MNREKEYERDQCTRYAVDRTKNIEASAERISPIENQCGRKRKCGAVYPRSKKEREQKQVPRRSFEENQKDAPIGIANTVNEAIAQLEMIAVNGGRFDTAKTYNDTYQKDCGEYGERLFSRKGAADTFAHTK